MFFVLVCKSQEKRQNRESNTLVWNISITLSDKVRSWVFDIHLMIDITVRFNFSTFNGSSVVNRSLILL